ncbi:MAG TPA: DUF962 domain-containing protein [Blastocatellia bacterium]|nr:DUF962 domain-containing protein [Blastocatellia bacterium]
MEHRITSFAEFWPFYLGEHRHPLNRILHFVGSSLGLVCWFGFLYTLNVWLIPLGLVLGYGGAWVGHFFIEKNKPASFSYPLWSFMADWRMWFCMLTGRIHSELKRASVL